MERIGLIITVTWTALIGILIYFKWSDAQAIPLNEWGDFLAGITAPIAFLWLIIGYALQRKELNLNTEALMHQASELKAQGKHMERTAKAAEEQADIASHNQLLKQIGLGQ